MMKTASRCLVAAPHRWIPTVLLAILCLATTPVPAQELQYTLDDDRSWDQTQVPEPGSDAETFAEVRRLLAEDRPNEARRRIDQWLQDNEYGQSIYLPQAYLLRGDAKVAMGREFKALFDYELCIRNYPQSESFPIAVERELAIGKRYLDGLRRKLLGLRVLDATEFGVEIMIRVQERMPDSALAEDAAITLADYYYRTRDIALAREAYDLYLLNFPNGPNRDKALRRRIFAEIARFKGPRYDASGFLNARVQIREFADRYPAQAAEHGLNDALIARLNESLAAQFLETADWYTKDGDWAAARLTLRRLIDTYPGTVSAQVAEQRMISEGWIAPPAEPADDTDQPERLPVDLVVESQDAAPDTAPQQPEPPAPETEAVPEPQR